MANDLTAALKTAFRRYFRSFVGQATFYQNFTSPILEVEPTFVESDVYGLTEYAPVVTSPTPQDIVSSNSSTAIGDFEAIVRVTKKETRDIPRLLEQAGAALGRLAALTVDNAWITALTTLDVTAHPEAGGTVIREQGGGTAPNFADQFQYNPPNGTTFDQANLFFDEIGPDALSNGLSARHAYRDKAGNRMDARIKPFLVVPSDHETTGIDLVSLQGPTYNGVGLQTGSFKDRIESVQTLPGPAADPLDWWLIWSMIDTDDEGRSHRRCGLDVILRGTPEITFTESPDSHHLFVKGFHEFAIHFGTTEAGIQMHSPNAT